MISNFENMKIDYFLLTIVGGIVVAIVFYIHILIIETVIETVVEGKVKVECLK